MDIYGDDDRFYKALSFENALIKNNVSSAATKFLGRYVNQTPFPGPLIKNEPFRPILLKQLKIMIRRLVHNKRTKKPHKGGVIFNKNDKIILQNPLTLKWEDFGQIVSARKSGRSFVVLKDNGRVVVRNRKFIKLNKFDNE